MPLFHRRAQFKGAKMENVRVQLDISARQLKELEVLMEVCNLTTKKDLFNNALSILQWAVEESERGNVIASINDSENKIRELTTPALAAARRHGSARISA